MGLFNELIGQGSKLAKSSYDDVYNWYVSRGYPESTSARVASGELDPSLAARQARMLEGRYNTRGYHGTNADISEFIPSSEGMQGPAVYSSSSPDVAAYYAEQRAKDGGAASVIPLRIRGDVADLSYVAERFPDTRVSDIGSIADQLRAEGITGLQRGNERVTFNPDDIRSVNAMFDPEYTGPNILGTTAATAGALGLLAAPEEAEAGFISRGGKTLLEAFHGSPYQFDRFDMSKIGTGEGAQAYGHGLYFADSEDLAKGYRDALTRPRFEVAGKPADSPYNADIQKAFSNEIDEAFQDQADSWAEMFVLQADAVGNPVNPDDLSDWVDAVRTGKDSEFPREKVKALTSVEDDIGMSLNDVYDIRTDVEDAFNFVMGNLSQIDTPDMSDYITQDIRPQTRHIYDQYIRDKIRFVEPEGAMYRTEIDVTPDSLLDWDKPLSEQSEAVRDGLMSTPYYQELRDAMLTNADQYVDDVDKVLSESTYSDIMDLASNYAGERPEVFSDQLSKNNVKGIKYLDGNSRAVGDGTSNYVIFDDSLINIADRYAIAPPMFAPSQDRALAAANKGLLGDAMTLDEQRIQQHQRDINKQMAQIGLLADPMYEYGDIIPAKTNIVTGETSLAFPGIARDIIGGLLDLANTRKSGVYNPVALMDVAL